MKQDFENDIREHLAQYGEQVPEGLWAEIEHRVGDVPQTDRQEKARVVVMRRWVAGVAASVALLIGGWYAVDRMGNAVSDKMTAMVEKEAMESDAVESEEAESDVVESEAIEMKEQTFSQNKRSTPTNAPLTKSEAAPTTAESTETLEIPDDLENLEALENLDNLDDLDGLETLEDSAPPATSDTPASPATRITPKLAGTPKHPRTLTFSARATNLLAANTMGSNNVQPLMMNMHYASPTTDAFITNGARRAPMYLANYEEETDHHLPLTIGLSARLSLTRRLWLESGLSYSYVASTFTHHLNTMTTTDEQRLHYVGVPLNVGYSFWQTPRLRTYVSGGTQADVCVKSTLQTHGGEGTLERDRVQFSFTLSAGVEYELLPHVGVYLQPGVTCYPDNGSRLQNIFKEKPTQPSLQFGLRYSLR